MLTVEDLKKARVGIVGFGKEGQAVARFLHKNGLTAHLYDEQLQSTFGEQELSILQAAGFVFHFGEKLSSFSDCTILFRSPGFHRLHPALVDAEAHGTVVTSQTKFFFDHCPAPIIGVTGTKGKGTTATLITRILEAACEAKVVNNLLHAQTRIFVTGNIGKLDPLDILPTLSSQDVVVFELSSFQLQDLTVSPRIGVCLMVTQEHLDHHVDLAEYHAAKSSIVAYQKPGDYAVYSDDYPASQYIGAKGQGAKYTFSRYHVVEQGAYVEDNRVHLVGTPQSGIFDVSHKLLPGAHNLENICAGSVAASVAGAPMSIIEKIVVNFSGLEHRLEYVGEYASVKFYNDSISTVPESAIAALGSFTAPTVLILGGSEKNSDFTELANTISTSSHVRGIIVVGVTAERIVSALSAAGYAGAIKQGAHNMTEIFIQIHELALPGDVVLLSPACASFGMFKNYKERGELFKDAAKKYA